MDKKLQEAISLYNKGEKAQASKLLGEIVQQNPNNSLAWYGLALCLTDMDKKIYCLQRTLSLDSSNQKAWQLLEKLQSMENPQGHNQPSKVSNISAVNKKPLPPQTSTQTGTPLNTVTFEQSLKKVISEDPLYRRNRLYALASSIQGISVFLIILACLLPCIVIFIGTLLTNGK